MTCINILLVEDDQDDRILFQDALNELQVPSSLSFANNGKEAIEQLTNQTNKPDILFLDLNMPLKSGKECLMDIRKNKQLPCVPVIIFSTCYDKEAAVSLYENGATRYIKKPTNFSNLKKVINKTLDMLVQQQLTCENKESFLIYP